MMYEETAELVSCIREIARILDRMIEQHQESIFLISRSVGYRPRKKRLLLPVFFVQASELYSNNDLNKNLNGLEELIEAFIHQIQVVNVREQGE